MIGNKYQKRRKYKSIKSENSFIESKYEREENSALQGEFTMISGSSKVVYTSKFCFRRDALVKRLGWKKIDRMNRETPIFFYSSHHLLKYCEAFRIFSIANLRNSL